MAVRGRGDRGALWFLCAALAGLQLGCGGDGPVGPDGNGGPSTPPPDPRIFGVGSGSQQFAQVTRIAGYDPTQQSATLVGVGQTEPTYAGLLRDSVVLGGQNPPVLTFIGSEGVTRQVTLAGRTQGRVHWFSDGGGTRAYVDVEGVILDVDLTSGAVLDSLVLPGVGGFTRVGTRLYMTQTAADTTLRVTVVDGPGFGSRSTLASAGRCLFADDIVVQPAGQLNVLCGGTNSEPGAVLSITATGQVVGRAVDSSILGSSIGGVVPDMVWVQPLGSILVLRRNSQVLRFDPSTATFTGSLVIPETGMAINSIGYHAPSSSIVTARTPSNFTLEGPFYFSLHGTDGAKKADFGRGTFNAIWVMAR